MRNNLTVRVTGLTADIRRLQGVTFKIKDDIGERSGTLRLGIGRILWTDSGRQVPNRKTWAELIEFLRS